MVFADGNGVRRGEVWVRGRDGSDDVELDGGGKGQKWKGFWTGIWNTIRGKGKGEGWLEDHDQENGERTALLR